MDISILDTNSIKVKGKQAAFVVDPDEVASRAKIAADAVILLLEKNINKFPNVEEYRAIIKGAGEYEISKMMIVGKKSETGIVYRIIIDGVDMVLGKASQIAKILDKIDSCAVLVLNADSEINQSLIGSLEPKSVILYGEKSREGAKSLDKGNINPVAKISLTKDKLPEAMEVAVLG